MNPAEYLKALQSEEDQEFDQIFPQEIRVLSHRHWTPVSVARKAARFLVTRTGLRVLDIGCGPGKFCIIGALTTPGEFVGVEQRENLVALARDTIRQAKIHNARIIHGNALEIPFRNFDAFYLFNPFQENLFKTGRIDMSVDFTTDLFKQYTEYVAAQLLLAPLGTRVATYCGSCEEIPFGYECRESFVDNTLKFWVKTLELPPKPGAPATSHKWRFLHDSAMPVE